MAIQDAGSISEEIFEEKAPYLIPAEEDETDAGSAIARNHIERCDLRAERRTGPSPLITRATVTRGPRVRDSDVGIEPELLPRIFDLFTQADKSLDRSQGGLGIGLSLVQSLVTMHHGRVEAYSKPGQGSEFIVTFPVLSSPSPSTAGPAETIETPARALRVLVVDDNLDTAKSVANLLRAYGHDARAAHDGPSAMQAALEYIPQVVLLDIGLPVMSGYEVAKCFVNSCRSRAF
jgi:CheY-like chemotaxis protein